MKSIFIILIAFIFQSISFACDYDSTTIKLYRLKQKITFKNVVKLTYNDDYSFFMESSEYLDLMSKEFNILNKYIGCKDTLFIKVYCKYDSITPVNNYSITIQKGKDINNIEKYTDTDLIKPDFSIFWLFHKSTNYIVYKLLKTKKLLIVNERTGMFAKRVVKEKYSYYCGPLMAGAGWRWKIRDTNFVIGQRWKWIS